MRVRVRARVRPARAALVARESRATAEPVLKLVDLLRCLVRNSAPLSAILQKLRARSSVRPPLARPARPEPAIVSAVTPFHLSSGQVLPGPHFASRRARVRNKSSAELAEGKASFWTASQRSLPSPRACDELGARRKWMSDACLSVKLPPILLTLHSVECLFTRHFNQHRCDKKTAASFGAASAATLLPQIRCQNAPTLSLSLLTNDNNQ